MDFITLARGSQGKGGAGGHRGGGDFPPEFAHISFIFPQSREAVKGTQQRTYKCRLGEEWGFPRRSLDKKARPCYNRHERAQERGVLPQEHCDNASDLFNRCWETYIEQITQKQFHCGYLLSEFVRETPRTDGRVVKGRGAFVYKVTVKTPQGVFFSLRPWHFVFCMLYCV